MRKSIALVSTCMMLSLAAWAKDLQNVECTTSTNISPTMALTPTPVDSCGYAVALTANADTVLVRVEIIDPMLQQLAVRSGVNIYIDLSAKKKEDYKVSFPATQLQEEQPAEDEDREKARERHQAWQSMAIAEIAMQNATLTAKKEESLLSQYDTSVSKDERGPLVYTFVLPKAKLGSKLDKQGRVNLAVQVNMPSDMPAGGPSGQGDGQRPPRGGMGGPGGGMGGHGGGMGGPGGGMGGPGGGMGGPGGGMGGPGMGGERPQGAQSRVSLTETVWLLSQLPSK
ncbi:MAG: hypothetical protein LIP02_08885 [Bacteroidales bacterium]|nr:hypothetical protein [Bacteroidales bacterium]